MTMIDIIDNFLLNEIFERKLAKYTGFKYCVCVDCCTNGILISLETLNYLRCIDKDAEVLRIPKHTYMSVPMTLKNNSWHINLVTMHWKGMYKIGKYVFDAATDFHQNMAKDYSNSNLVCVSFQLKKRLSLGRGGAILFNDKKYLNILMRLRYDGRNSYMSDKDEISTNPDQILCGYHCYMEPDKAAKGITIMNLILLLPKYVLHSWKEYAALDKLRIFNV